MRAVLEKLTELDGLESNDGFLFRPSDEIEFKKQFVIQFLASHQALHYQDNLKNGFGCPKRTEMEDVETLAEDAWMRWAEFDEMPQPAQL